MRGAKSGGLSREQLRGMYLGRILYDLWSSEPLSPRARIVFSKRSIDPHLEHRRVGDRVYAVKQSKNGRRRNIVTTVLRVDERLEAALEATGESGDAPASGIRLVRPKYVSVPIDLVPLLQNVFGPRTRREIVQLAQNVLENATARVADDCRRTVLGQEPVDGAVYWRDGRLFLGVKGGVLVDVVYQRRPRAA
ncbi:hypothetical protein EPN90_01420 [Patescibacteria group bacterium]|nr:MAG: hypothetical protein EPN90_01420 [Patescibacteria group bacterium]